jgi:leucyl-tRNA---protein transferase
MMVMKTAFHFLTPPHACGYLPEETARLEYEGFARLSPAEYMQRMRTGWRRFGHATFRPRCPACAKCQSLRVDVARFRPNRSQRRVRKLNDGAVDLRIGDPVATREKLLLHDRFHAFQAQNKGWPYHGAKDAEAYQESFVWNPFPTEEWCYFLGEQLVGVGYVDHLPGGLSAIYFFYDPDYRDRSLGIWNVLSIIDYAARQKIPYVYLGYYVAGCGSMEYKATFTPNQVLRSDGQWHDFRS